LISSYSLAAFGKSGLDRSKKTAAKRILQSRNLDGIDVAADLQFRDVYIEQLRAGTTVDIADMYII